MRKSNSKAISIQKHGPSALNQEAPSINFTIASAADAGAPNSPAFWSCFCANKATDTKVEITLFGTCFISVLGLIYQCHCIKVALKSAEFQEILEKLPFSTNNGLLGGYLFNLQLIYSFINPFVYCKLLRNY